ADAIAVRPVDRRTLHLVAADQYGGLAAVEVNDRVLRLGVHVSSFPNGSLSRALSCCPDKNQSISVCGSRSSDGRQIKRCPGIENKSPFRVAAAFASKRSI